MFGIGSRTHYALWHDIVFNFEYVRDRNYFIAHSKDAKILSAHDAYKREVSNAIRVDASCKLGANKKRKQRINNWYVNK